MSKKRVLFVTQEMKPYTTLSEMSELVRKLPQFAQDKGFEIRVLMPRFGTINERRHRLHEVVRLSGMNIIVDDEDYPLIIKVASLPGARMQVYFLDNEEFFKRKFVFEDEEGKPFEDNQDRMVFFCKGVMETVKKFGWAPDIIHCHGPMTSLVPLFQKKVYHNDPIFEDAKVVYSVYNNDLESSFDDRFLEIAAINDLEEEDIAPYSNGTAIKLNEGGITYADALVRGSNELPADVNEKIEASGVETQQFIDIDDQLQATIDFYNTLIGEEEEEEEA
ncbi:MAG: glycogen/starch synthase [Saprospiraceae bacterium]|nr:glycogen/starch synthase [Saprospiraceae bacterium]